MNDKKVEDLINAEVARQDSAIELIPSENYVSNDVLEDLAGKEGVAHTTLRPAGIAKINGNLVDVVTEGDFIDAGSPIVVLRVVGGRNIVRKRD